MIFFVCFLLLFNSINISIGQNHRILNLQINHNFAKIDKNANIYIVNNNNISKYNSKGELLATFSNPNFGSIDFIDVSNPLNILVFFKKTQTLLRLDNTLSPKANPINFNDLQIFEATLIATGQENGFWVFDNFNSQLNFIDFNGNKMYVSNIIRRINNSTYEFLYMGFFNSLLHIVSENNLVYLFDLRGNFVKNIDIKTNNIIVNYSGIYTFQDKTIFGILYGSENTQNLTSNINEIKSFDCYFPHLLLSYKDRIELYLLNRN